MTEAKDGTARTDALEERMTGAEHPTSDIAGAAEPGRSATVAFLKTPFLSASPESFGLVPDACPVATRYILIGADGHEAESGGRSPQYGCPGGGAGHLLSGLYPMLPQDAVTADLIRMTLGGDCDTPQEHLLARLCAVLVEAAAFHILNSAPDVMTASEEMNRKLPACLDSFRRQIQIQEEGTQVESGEQGRDSRTEQKEPELPAEAVYGEEYYQVSFCACRVCPTGKESGDFSVEIYAAGDFCVYLLDGNGLSPLWVSRNRPLSPRRCPEVICRTVDLHHPEPFALLLLSDGLCQSARTNRRTSMEAPGRLWRGRMQLEEQILHAFIGADREEEFGRVAAQVFAGRATGRDSMSGAMTLLSSGDVSYDVFRSLCRERLSTVQEMLSMIPEDYDPDRVVRQDTLARTERAFAAELFRTRPQLLDKTLDMLDVCIRDRLALALSHPDQVQKEVESTDGKQDAGTLTPDVVYGVYRRFDRENDSDRAQILKNRKTIRRTLSGHWVTLRPLLCSVQEARTETGKTETDIGLRMYQACLDMNNRLEAMLTERRARLEKVKELLSGSLTVLNGSCDDWVIGRGSRSGVSEWLRNLTETLPPLLDPMTDGWLEETERFRSLQTAYTSEREALFTYDTDAGHGVFFDAFAQMMAGTLPDDIWDAFCQAAEGKAQLAGYGEMLKVLRVVSREIGRLSRTVEGRAAERRCVLTMRAEFEWQFACLRASVYKDTSWHPDIETLLDPGTRSSYLQMVKQWQQTEALHTRQRQIFEAYQSMYETYVQG